MYEVIGDSNTTDTFYFCMVYFCHAPQMSEMCLKYSDLIPEMGDQYIYIFQNNSTQNFHSGNTCWYLGYAKVIAITMIYAV